LAKKAQEKALEARQRYLKEAAEQAKKETQERQKAGQQ